MKRKIAVGMIGLIASLSIGCTLPINEMSNMSEEDLVAFINNKQEEFENKDFAKEISDMSRKTEGEFNIFWPHFTSEEDRRINKVFNNGGWNEVYELNNLKENQIYNIKLTSIHYEKDVEKNREEIFSKDIKGSENMYIVNESGIDSKRNVKLHFTNSDEILETLEYYLPSNWNTGNTNNNIAFNSNDEITFMMYDRGIKNKDGKYKTASANFSLEGEKLEKSINNTMKKNEQTVIIKMKISPK